MPKYLKKEKNKDKDSINKTNSINKKSLKNESLIDTKSELQSKSCESEISGKCIIHYKDLETPYYHGSIPDEWNRFMPYIHGLLGDNNLTDR